MEKENIFQIAKKLRIIFAYESYIGHFKNGKKEGDFTLIYGSGEM